LTSSSQDSTSIIDSARRAQHARIGYFVLAGCTVIGTILSFLQYKEISGDGINVTAFSDYVDWSERLLFLQIPVSLYTHIAFMAWMHRSYGNLGKLGVKLRFHPSMAVVGWFIPLVNLFCPPTIAGEIWRKTRAVYTVKEETEQVVRNEGEPREENESTPVGMWWFFNLLGAAVLIFGVYATTTGDFGSRWDSQEKLLVLTMAANGCFLVSMLTAADILKQMTSAEKVMFAHVEKQLESGLPVIPEHLEEKQVS
jgi:hypothetical protein